MDIIIVDVNFNVFVEVVIEKMIFVELDLVVKGKMVFFNLMF